MSDWILYVCPICGRTIRWPAVSTEEPNRICYHGAHVGYMDIVASGPPQKAGRDSNEREKMPA